jgi:glyoxylase-like metal-dependent hydrolase (beta-lactamase superfamily II)
MADPFDKDATAVYGAAEWLEPGIRRITCRNPSPMTFTGTQTYLLGRGAVALIDPGPDMEDHRAAILAALEPGERIATILVTHSHSDHSPGVAPLKAATGAEVLAFGPHGAGRSARMAALAACGARFGGGEGADPSFAPDRLLADGEVAKGDGWAVRALHTPGHLSNHLAFAVEGLDGGAPGAVFSGDHVMAWATTMVSPPDGDMAAFMASLRRMQGRWDRIYYPGHGAPVRDPEAMLAHQIAHRAGREAQILSVLAEIGAATPAQLTARIYADVDPALHPAAARNVLSHLIGMLEDGRAAVDGDLAPDARFRARFRAE